MSTVLRGLVLDETSVISRSELCGSGCVTPEELDILDALGLVTQSAPGTYPASSLHHINRALRLRRGLEIDWEVVGLIMDLLREIEALKAKARHLEAIYVYQNRQTGDDDEGG